MRQRPLRYSTVFSCLIVPLVLLLVVAAATTGSPQDPVAASTTATSVVGSTAAEATALAVATTAVGQAATRWPNQPGLPPRDEDVPQRFLTMNPLQPWYGLTNQLMCYAAALRYGVDDRRAVLFPSDHRAVDGLPFYSLFDVDATQARLGALVKIMRPSQDDIEHGYGTRPPQRPQRADLGNDTVPNGLYPPTSMNKKKLHLPERSQYRSRSVAALKVPRLYLTGKVYPRSREWPFVRHHNFFMRFAWPSREVDHDSLVAPDWNECRFMAALEPVAVVRQYFDALEDRIRSVGGGAHSKYVAVHLRVEADASLLRPKASKSPSPSQFERFLDVVAAPFAHRYNASIVYLCTGAVPPALAAVVGAWNSDPARRVKVVYRALLTGASGRPLPVLPQFKGHQRAMHQSVSHATQDHYASAVELLVLTRAAAASATAYSSLRYAVFAKRCSGFGSDTASGRGDDPAVHTTTITADGDMSGFTRYPCSGANTLGWCGHVDWSDS